MVISFGDYEIRPYKSTCWQIFRLIEGSSGEPHWVALDIYPGSLARAIEVIYERRLREDGGTEGLEAAIARAEEVAADLRSVLERLGEPA